jgi:hypothetical protein
MLWLGMAGRGVARRGKARQGKGHSVGVLRIVSAAGECYGSAWQGEAGEAWQGKARVTRLAYCGSFPQRVNVMAWRGAAWQGEAWHGEVRRGCFGTWWRFRKSSGRGRAGLGKARLGKVGLGKGFNFQTLTKD